MEVFDKEGVAVRKNRSEGFVMAEVLVTVLFVTVFTSLLFSSGARRYRSALNFAAGTEARLQIENGCFHAFDMVAPSSAAAKRARSFLLLAFEDYAEKYIKAKK